MKATAALLIVLLAAPAAALASDPPAPKPPMNVWTGTGQLGFLASQGNSEAKSANGLLDLAYLTGPWKHSLHLGLLYGENAGITSAERWNALWQSDYSITPRLYAFGTLRYEHDLFDGFQYQGSGAAGLGYKILQTQSISLSGQVGAGYMLSRPELLTKNAAGAVIARTLQPSQDYAIATAGLQYSQKLTATTTLSDTFLVNAGSANTLITNALALTVKMSTQLALSLGYNIQDNTKPPAGIKSLDSTETVNLVFAF